MKKAVVILGLGYGDEGKGLVTDYYCRQAQQPLVIRFNGGHQAGHTVVLKNGTRHVFSNFGSGTLRGIPTYWSAYCTFSPRYILEELSLLPTTPTLYLDPACPVTTHYDVLYNRALEISRGKNRYGSCGVGFGATIDRHKQRRLKLTVIDILSPNIVYQKLQQIRAYYQDKLLSDTGYDFSLFDHDQEDAQLMDDLSQLALLKKEKIIQVIGAAEIFRKRIWREYIFEGAQGIQLDQSFGHAPYITKSNTTSQNAKKLLLQYTNLTSEAITVCYVSRCYQTRHGNGPFENPVAKLLLRNTRHETNRTNEYQGVFRTAPLNLGKLNASLAIDRRFSRANKKELVITCLDQVNALKIPTNNGIISYHDIPAQLHTEFTRVLFSFNSCSDFLK